MSSAHSRVFGRAFALAAMTALSTLTGSVAPGATTSYEYDALGRLRVVTHDNRIATTYTLDPAGNRTQLTDVAVSPTSAPASISVPTSSSTGDYSISWGAAAGAVLTYELYESTSPAFSTSTRVHNASARTTSFVGKPNNTTYYYRVRACSSSDCSGFTTGANGVTVVVTPPPLLPPPTNLAKIHTANCVWRATWNPVEGAANYIVRDTAGAEQTVVSPIAHVACPINNQNANQPRWVKACSPAGVCSSVAFFP